MESSKKWKKKDEEEEDGIVSKFPETDIIFPDEKTEADLLDLLEDENYLLKLKVVEKNDYYEKEGAIGGFIFGALAGKYLVNKAGVKYVFASLTGGHVIIIGALVMGIIGYVIGSNIVKTRKAIITQRENRRYTLIIDIIAKDAN